jgi:hypothetical protein
MPWTQADIEAMQARRAAQKATTDTNLSNLNKGPVKARRASDNQPALGEAKKPKKRNRKEESNMQKRCVTWFRMQYKRELLFAVPNGSHLAGTAAQRAIQVNTLKAEGMLVGVSDLILVADNGVYFLEAKAKDGSQRPNQKEFEALVKAMAYEYHIFRSLEEFQGIVNKLIEK